MGWRVHTPKAESAPKFRGARSAYLLLQTERSTRRRNRLSRQHYRLEVHVLGI